QLFFCCFLLSDIHLVFANPIPHGELIRFLAQCGPFTLTCRGSAGPIGTFLLRLDSRSACFIFSRRYWRGNSGAFLLRLWRSCAALRGRSLLALPPSRL